MRIEGNERVYSTYASTPFLTRLFDTILELAMLGEYARLAQFVDVMALIMPEEFREIYSKEKLRLEAEIPEKLEEWIHREGRELARNEAELHDLARQQHDYLLAAARLQAFAKAGEETGLTWYRKRLVQFM